MLKTSLNYFRHWTLFGLLALASLPIGSTAYVYAADSQRPNILFIFADDLTCQAISAYGDERKLLQTPNMDRLAKQGMRFDRCLVTNSICGPAMCCLVVDNCNTSALLRAGKPRSRA